MDLTGQLSNPQPALEALIDQDIGTTQDSPTEQARPPSHIPRLNRRTARPLKPAQIDALISGYEAGKTMKELAAEFGINRLTVSAHLHRAGVPIRQGGLDANQATDVARLYVEGWSSLRLAKRFNVSPDYVLKTLRSASVAIRPRQGGPSAKATTTGQMHERESPS